MMRGSARPMWRIVRRDKVGTGKAQAATMREQRITLRLGTATGNPDAEVALRTAISILKFLEVVDRKKWAVGHPRYKWEITGANKQSPCTLEYSAVYRAKHYDRPEDIVGDAIRRLRGIGEGREDAIAGLDAEDLKTVIHIGNGKKNHSIPVNIEIPSPDGTSVETLAITEAVRANAKIFQIKMMAVCDIPKTQYVTLEGELFMIKVRERRSEYVLGLIDRDTGREIICHFNPMNSSDIGAHIGHRILVEGEQTTMEDGKSRLDVTAYRLISKDPMDLRDIHALRLTLPDDMSPSEYIRTLRANDA